MNLSVKQIERKANEHRKTILKVINRTGKGHVGGAFSCIDILSALYYGNILNISKSTINDPNRNRFLLSKGHACVAQYVILNDLGFFDNEELFKMVLIFRHMWSSVTANVLKAPYGRLLAWLLT